MKNRYTVKSITPRKISEEQIHQLKEILTLALLPSTASHGILFCT
jgi:hypothetical protein